MRYFDSRDTALNVRWPRAPFRRPSLRFASTEAPWENPVDPLEGFYLHELRRKSVESLET